MSAASASQSATAFETNKCNPAVRRFVDRNPETSSDWSDLVQQWIGSVRSPAGTQLEPELNKGSHHIRLCGLRRWKAGDEDAKGSGLNLEHFLHLRALVKRHENEDLPLRELVEAKYAEAAEVFLGNWQDFDNYISQVPSNDPALDVDNLGMFAGAKLLQNQVLLDAYLGTPQDGADSFQDSVTETPLKKFKPGINFNMEPPDNDAADEQIVNQALISFASALTRRWMVQKTPAAAYATNQTPTKGGGAAPTHDWKTVADWTMARDRFHIRERRRKDDRIQTGHMEGLMASTRKDNLEVLADNHSYARVMTSETDGSLYCIDAGTTEILAIVEAKKRLRRRNRLKIEWQEAAEILAWLNLRLRNESVQHGGKGKGPLTPRRGMLKAKPAAGKSREKSRCLLVAQDREEIYLLIGEWDALYEDYALEGKFSDAHLKTLKRLDATGDPAQADAGFLTLHVHQQLPPQCRGLLPYHKPLEHLVRFRVSSSNSNIKANGLLVDKQLRRCNYAATHAKLPLARGPNNKAPRLPLKRIRTRPDHRCLARWRAGPSSFSTPSGAAVPPDVRVPSQPQQEPDETPVKKKKKDKKNTPIKDIFSLGKKKDKGDKK
ncbi:hypothetical protein INS49_003367 [Diaporthe citri]|uniref:uncharacterized protein n=1 Tax=Diaporthe citri TaxID=83186 RepID=UPI001C81E5B3|nr:uncharacterized protein INS49_003367 [Diaporthe citri]KAG6355405.1 hypothetical protein INS49_003367 [Diaporthe citri]